MSKAGFILYGAKGKIGNIVAQKSKAGTILREKVDPTNPNTKAQVTQRSQFLDVVKFYKNATENFFKMAFPGKKSNESDFNAYMRLSSGKGIMITPEMAADYRFSFPGDFRVSEGTLTPAVVSRVENESTVALSVSGLSTTDTTIGKLSELLIAQYDLVSGDIVTLVQQSSAIGDILENAEVQYLATKKPVWTIKQFKIDAESEETIASVLGTSFTVAANMLKMKNTIDTVAYQQCAVIFSRNTDTGLLVSTADMVSNYSEMLDNLRNSDTYKQAVMSAWNAKNDAILQGSLS